MSNYASACTEETLAFLTAQYDEDVVEGMAAGPFDSDECLAAFLGCPLSDLRFGALAVRDEADREKHEETDAPRCYCERCEPTHLAPYCMQV